MYSENFGFGPGCFDIRGTFINRKKELIESNLILSCLIYLFVYLSTYIIYLYTYVYIFAYKYVYCIMRLGCMGGSGST